MIVSMWHGGWPDSVVDGFFVRLIYFKHAILCSIINSIKLICIE